MRLRIYGGIARKRHSRDLVTSDTSIEAAIEPVKLFKGICEGGCEVGSRFAVQPLCLV
jgi:hypothetical protein